MVVITRGPFAGCVAHIEEHPAGPNMICVNQKVKLILPHTDYKRVQVNETDVETRVVRCPADEFVVKKLKTF